MSSSNTKFNINENVSMFDRIKTPKQLKVSDKGKIDTLVHNVKALEKYINIIIQGDGPWKALTNSNIPLGSSGFVDTNMLCTDPPKKPRYIYNDSIPKGDNKSLIFSVLNDIEDLIPGDLLSGGSKKSSNDSICKEANLLVTNELGEQCFRKEYIGLNDLIDIDPCMYEDGIIPEDTLTALRGAGNVITNTKCKSGKKFCGFDESGNPNPPGKGCVQSCQWFPPPPESSTDDEKESFKNRHRTNKKYQVFFIYLFHVLLIYMLLRLFYKKIAK